MAFTSLIDRRHHLPCVSVVVVVRFLLHESPIPANGI